MNELSIQDPFATWRSIIVFSQLLLAYKGVFILVYKPLHIVFIQSLLTKDPQER